MIIRALRRFGCACLTTAVIFLLPASSHATPTENSLPLATEKAGVTMGREIWASFVGGRDAAKKAKTWWELQVLDFAGPDGPVLWTITQWSYLPFLTYYQGTQWVEPKTGIRHYGPIPSHYMEWVDRGWTHLFVGDQAVTGSGHGEYEGQHELEVKFPRWKPHAALDQANVPQWPESFWRNGMQFVRIGEKEHGPFDPFDWLTKCSRSKDLQHFYFGASRQTKRYVVHDGKEYGPFDELPEYGFALDGARFSPDSQRFVFHARRGRGWFIILDGQEFGPFDSPMDNKLRHLEQHFVFSPDSKRFAFAARRDGKWRVVVDGDELPESFRDARVPLFSPDSQYLALEVKREKAWYLILNARMFGPFQDVREYSRSFSPDSQRLGFVARRNGAYFVCLDGKEFGPFKDASGLIFSPDRERFAFAARTSSGWHIVLDRTESASFDSIDFESMEFSHDSKHMWAYAKRGKKWFILLDKQEYGPFTYTLGKPWYSQPGGHFLGVVAQTTPNARTTEHLVVDGHLAKGYERVFENTILLDDPKRVTYVAGQDARLYVVTQPLN